MTSNIRRALFEVVMVLTVEHDNTVIIDHGDNVSQPYQSVIYHKVGSRQSSFLLLSLLKWLGK